MHKEHRLSDIVLPEATERQVKQIISEFHQKRKIESYGLKNTRKILIVGKSGTGKTMLANIIADELSHFLSALSGDWNSIIKKIADSKKLRTLFLFDNFEMQISPTIQDKICSLLDDDDSDNFFIVISKGFRLDNGADMTGLFLNLFDEIICLNTPTRDEAKRLLKNRLSQFLIIKDNEWGQVLPTPLYDSSPICNLAQRDIVNVCNSLAKKAILTNTKIGHKELHEALSAANDLRGMIGGVQNGE